MTLLIVTVILVSANSVYWGWRGWKAECDRDWWINECIRLTNALDHLTEKDR